MRESLDIGQGESFAECRNESFQLSRKRFEPAYAQDVQPSAVFLEIDREDLFRMRPLKVAEEPAQGNSPRPSKTEAAVSQSQFEFGVQGVHRCPL